MNCANCVFWNSNPVMQPPMPGMPPQMPLPQGLGQCRRNAPFPLPMPPMGMQQMPPLQWPVTTANDTCGECKVKE
jgi:hypothetical protein